MTKKQKTRKRKHGGQKIDIGGIFRPGPDKDRLSALQKKVQDHLYDGPLDERSYTPGSKDERALYMCRYLARRSGSLVFEAVADVAEGVRISRDWRGRTDDVSVMQSEQQLELERQRIELLKRQAAAPERR